jgi:thiamine-phosphate pyrophosphorylase
MISLPRLYAILDSSSLSIQKTFFAAERLSRPALPDSVPQHWRRADMLAQGRGLHRRLRGAPARHFDNERPLRPLSGGGIRQVHVILDTDPFAGRSLAGSWLGVSTHHPPQVIEADQPSADYIAIGPVFATGSKSNPDPVIGLAGLRQARALTRKPLVAIGGITRENCRSVVEAGADSVAVISDLTREPRKSAEEFLRILR